jgi:predicted branched-subunit amino acid permease
LSPHEPSSPASEPKIYARACLSRRGAYVAGLRDAVGSPALVLGASFIGFGSLIRELGLGLDVAFFSMLTTWALPAQVATLEMFAVGAPLFSVFIAVALINFRFLPMTVSLLPILRQPGKPVWPLYIVAQFTAVSTWVLAMLRAGEMPPDQRLPYFFGATTAMLAAGFVGTTAGYVAAGAVAPQITHGLVFMNPCFFMLVLLVDLRQRARIAALLIGAAAGPALHALTPTWGLLIAGLGAGTIAFFGDRWWEKRRV